MTVLTTVVKHLIQQLDGLTIKLRMGLRPHSFFSEQDKIVTMQITTVLAFITAMGGLEAVKWLAHYITCRNTDARKEEASVSEQEEENRRKKVDWFEERLTLRDEKIDGLYAELRKEQEDKINWIHKCHEVELVQKESEIKKCEIRGCVKRIPPSDY